MTTPIQSDAIHAEKLLVEHIAQQDQSALSALYDRYARVIYSIAYKSLGSVEESEEVVLDVFGQVWRTADRYDARKARVDTWLFMMARSRVLDRLRARQRLSRKADAMVEDVQTQQPSPDPIENVVISERRTHVLAALEQIPIEQRQMIEMAYYQGLSHSEISQQTGISLGTVKTRIRLGLNKLRVSLGNWQEQA
jgi:RNA polymerase sigma factor (sigma-70 family)